MGNEVYANNMEVSCKSADGKSIACFPDVCFTPPQTPATPPGVPIPYPNTGMAKDTTNGTRTVKITGKEVMLKNKSYFKTSYGDEAGCAPKKGVITSKIKGKVYFTSWSMDVKFEGENVVRHFDLTTHNHASSPGNTPPWLYTDKMKVDGTPAAGPCKETAEAVESTCTNTTYKNDQSKACCNAKKCMLTTYGAQPECCDGKTKHHIVPDHCFKGPGSEDYYSGIKDMSHGKGLCICVSGKDKNAKRKQHARIHDSYDAIEDSQPDGKWTFAKARDAAADTCSEVTGCNKACLKQQMNQYYKDKGVNDSTVLRADSGGNRTPPPRSEMGTRSVANGSGP
ncbi:DUF4150 domain-containing protein [Ectopseudomonas mendocina]|nr:DUF4150 domain-containing protein [Pseudomonas mendocina]